MFIVADTCTMPVDVDGAPAPFLPIVVKAHDWLPWALVHCKKFRQPSQSRENRPQGLGVFFEWLAHCGSFPLPTSRS